MIYKRMFSTLLAIALSASAAVAQAPELTIERIYTSRSFDPDELEINWLHDGQRFTYVEQVSPRLANLYTVNARAGQQETLVRGSDLRDPTTGEPILIEDYAFSADESRLLIFANVERIWRHSRQGDYWVWDLERRQLTPVSEHPAPIRYAKFSPDASHVAFVRENDLYVKNLETGEEVALTHDGSDDIINGASDWVYEEELVLDDGFRWSPDGSQIAYYKFDQSPIPAFYLINELELYPQIAAVRYPKAGTQNSRVQLYVVDLGTGESHPIDAGAEPNGYIARMDFADSPDEIWIQTLNRHQNRMELRLADVGTGRSRPVMVDEDEAWIELTEPVWFEGGRRFVYLSERDGYAHIYLYARDGTLERRLTSGSWPVAEIVGVDPDRGYVYFTGHRDGPLVRPLYRVGLNAEGGGVVRVGEADGQVEVEFDPTYTHYVETRSWAGVPPVQTLRDASSGERVRVLEDNDDIHQRLAGLNDPEFIKIPVDGAELNAWIIKPPDFDPSRRYPLLMYVYGGPGSQTVTDSWGGDRYLWHQIMAMNGYLVASVDNRGTGARGAEFKKLTYLRLGSYESSDQIAAARHLGQLPYVDSDRIGIWGWSYGGYMTALTMFRGNEVFKAGISVAPVTDWRLYDTIYTERYMRTPRENPEGYARGAPAAYADRLEGAFLLVHGTGDDNVHPQNSTLLVEQLIRANKQFDFRPYPNKAHSISGPIHRINLYTMMTQFLKENL